MSSILVAAFNKRIATELQKKLANGRSTFNRWSDQQNAIFDWFEGGKGNLTVRARAGVGKTTTLLEGVSRVKGGVAEAKTLHSLGYGMVMKNWGRVNLDDRVSFKDKRSRRLAVEAMETDEPKQMATLVAKLMTYGREMQPFAKKVEDIIDIAYEFDCDPSDDFYRSGWNIERICELAIKAMRLAKKKTQIIDFSDMLYLPVALGWANPRFDLTCIDEAQDLNVCQLELAQRVTKKNGRFVVIGDDRQAIYGFRGADSGSIDRLKRELGATELPLNTTYRCPRLIVAEANRLVPDYNAAPEAPEGVIDSIQIDRIHEHVQPKNFVLSRTNAALIKTCLYLLKNRIRAKIEGKDLGRRLGSIARTICGDSTSLIEDFEKKAQEWCSREVQRAMDRSREKQAENVVDQYETLLALAEGCTTVDGLLSQIDDLFGDAAALHGVVVCSTVHRAKGLESKRVFLLRDTLYPGLRAKYGHSRLQEEQNIEYVAITRAMSQLTWVEGSL